MRTLLVSATVVLLFPLAVGAAASPAEPRGTIAYTLAVDVWTVGAGGTRRTRVTRGGEGTQPSWSADGRQLLYVPRYRSGLGVMRPDGTGVRSIPLRFGSATDPDWARDGRIAFVSLYGGLFPLNSRPNGIWVMNADGSDLRQLVRYGSSPDWSPDGTRVAYTERVDADVWAVAVVGADGGASTRVAAGHSPAWSPAGTRLAYVAAGGAITVANADGTGVRTVVPCGGSPAWSPDGRWLAYLSCRSDFRTQVYVVPSAGGRPTPVTKYAGSYGAPDWRPAGPAAGARAIRP